MAVPEIAKEDEAMMQILSPTSHLEIKLELTILNVQALLLSVPSK